MNFDFEISRVDCIYNKKKMWQYTSIFFTLFQGGRSGGAKALGSLPGLGGPTNLDNSRARAYRDSSWCGWGLFGHLFSHLSFPFSFSLSGRRPDIY